MCSSDLFPSHDNTLTNKHTNKHTNTHTNKQTHKQTHSFPVTIGAGTGLLTKEMFLLYPEARFTLIDLSADMLEIAKTRFAGLDNFEYLEDDYISHLPNDYDIICSALSIHHLENDDKPNVYANICKSLSDGGIFVTLDQFCASSPIINDMYNTWWMNYIDKSGITSEQKAAWLERKKIDKEVSIEATVCLLREAGFRSVECVIS